MLAVAFLFMCFFVPLVASLPGAVVSLHRSHRGLALGLAGGGECTARLRIVSELFPLGAPGRYRRLQICLSSRWDLARDAGLVSVDEVVAFSDPDRLSCVRVRIAVAVSRR